MRLISIMDMPEKLCLWHGFYGLGLHKIFARCMPENTPSRNLLHATGFFEEGIERDSILIQGKWEDHIRYAILNPDEIHS